MRHSQSQLLERIQADHREMNLLVGKLEACLVDDFCSRRAILHEYLLLSGQHRTIEACVDANEKIIAELQTIHESILFFIDDLFGPDIQQRVCSNLIERVGKLLGKHIEVEEQHLLGYSSP